MVQSSRTPVIDMTAFDTENDHDSDNSAPTDAPPPRVWNEAQDLEGDVALTADGHNNLGMSGSDTESVGAVSDVSLRAPSVMSEPEAPVEEVTISAAIREALRSLDTVDVGNIFRRRASVMRTPPKFLCGAFRSALRVALHEIVNGAERREESIQCQGWKLFLLLPRMLLFRNPRGGKIQKQQLRARFAAFWGTVAD